MKAKKSKPLAIAGVMGFLGVAMGAFGTHALETTLNAVQMRIYQTATHYQLLHSVVLLVLAMAPRFLRKAFNLITIGVVIFSGSLYLLSLTGVRWFGAITPLGGLAILAGWGCIIAEGVSRGRDSYNQ